MSFKIVGTETKANNFWLGDNELVIVPEYSKPGVWSVIERFENWNSVYCGTYNDCRNFCEDMQSEYANSLY